MGAAPHGHSAGIEGTADSDEAIDECSKEAHGESPLASQSERQQQRQDDPDDAHPCRWCLGPRRDVQADSLHASHGPAVSLFDPIARNIPVRHRGETRLRGRSVRRAQYLLFRSVGEVRNGVGEPTGVGIGDHGQFLPISRRRTNERYGARRPTVPEPGDGGTQGDRSRSAAPNRGVPSIGGSP